MIDKTKETEMAIITALSIILLIAIICLLASCNTKKVLTTETITVHDTISTHHTDTIHDVRFITHTDTLKQLEFHNVTLSQKGDTIKEIHHYFESVKTILIDSTNRYKATVDSLKEALSQEKRLKETVKYKSTGKWWEWLLIIACVVALFSAAIKLRRT